MTQSRDETHVRQRVTRDRSKVPKGAPQRVVTIRIPTAPAAQSRGTYIEALRNQKGVGEWSVEQLQQLRDTAHGRVLLPHGAAGSAAQ